MDDEIKLTETQVLLCQHIKALSPATAKGIKSEIRQRRGLWWSEKLTSEQVDKYLIMMLLGS